MKTDTNIAANAGPGVQNEDFDQSSNRPLTSKAVTYKALGGPEVIQFVERTVRAPAAGEVRIEVKGAAVNPADILFRDPGFANLTSNIVPGMNAAGVVESVGPGVSRLHPGQKVIAAVNPVRPEGGAQAQHIVMPAASVVPIPEGVSLAQGSILLMTGLTALNALEIAAASGIETHQSMLCPRHRSLPLGQARLPGYEIRSLK
jgi:NADPH:quinone reductase